MCLTATAHRFWSSASRSKSNYQSQILSVPTCIWLARHHFRGGPYGKGRDQNEFGVDYWKCGICGYFARKNIFEYVKYCCLVDYAIMRNLGIAFSRTVTLGNGSEKCDFRFAKEGKIVEGWPPTDLKEFNGINKH